MIADQVCIDFILFVYNLTEQSRTWEVLDWGDYFSDTWAANGTPTGPTCTITAPNGPCLPQYLIHKIRNVSAIIIFITCSRVCYMQNSNTCRQHKVTEKRINNIGEKNLFIPVVRRPTPWKSDIKSKAVWCAQGRRSLNLILKTALVIVLFSDINKFYIYRINRSYETNESGKSATSGMARWYKDFSWGHNTRQVIVRALRILESIAAGDKKSLVILNRRHWQQQDQILQFFENVREIIRKHREHGK